MKLVRILVASVVLVACARDGARPSTSAPATGGGAQPAPSTIEEAEEQIAEAQMELGGGARQERRDDVAQAAPAPPPPPPHPPSARTEAADATATSTATDACASPCRAFASMRRAVDALCRMTGETDDRCTRARQKLAASTERVAPCRCRS